MSEVGGGIIGVGGIIIGVVGTYVVQRYTEKKRQFLSTKREQLQYVYAPLEVLLKMNKAEFERYFDSNTTKEDKEYIETHIWYPNNLELRKIIMEKAHLLPEIPDMFLKLLTHIDVWLTEYDLIYVKKVKPSPVFAGPKGYGYPKEVDAYVYSRAAELRRILNSK